MELLSGVTRSTYRLETSGRGKKGAGNSWTLPDGVCKTPDLWSLIVNERLLEAVRTLLGPDIRFLHHNDLHVGYSKIDWHRDNVTRSIGLGPDWDEANETIPTGQSRDLSAKLCREPIPLGFIKGSHRLDKNTSLWKRKFAEKALAWTGALSYLLPMAQTWAAHAEWVATQPGDCILFDPRTLHSGSYITGPEILHVPGLWRREFALLQSPQLFHEYSFGVGV